MNVDRGRLDEEIVQAFFEGEDEQVKTVEVMLRPQVWIRLLKHGKERTAGAPYSYASGYFRTVEPRGLLFPASPATIPRDLLEPLPKGTFSIGEMTEYDRYKTTHDSVTFGPEDEDEQREETDEQQVERYARYKQLWQTYLKETNELLKVWPGNGSMHQSNMSRLDMAM